MNKTLLRTALAGALLLGGVGTAAIPSIVAAADPAPSPGTTTTAPAPGTTDDGVRCGPGKGEAGDRTGPGKGNPYGHVETVSNMKIAADAIGISEADLVAQLQAGKSMADVAKANNADVQKVIDALVADEKAEIAAAVAAGTETQAQADQELATLVQRITDRVNHAGLGRGGHGHGPAGDPGKVPSPAATPTPAG